VVVAKMIKSSSVALIPDIFNLQVIIIRFSLSNP
jgi:hypothetical protein